MLQGTYGQQVSWAVTLTPTRHMEYKETQEIALRTQQKPEPCLRQRYCPDSCRFKHKNTVASKVATICAAPGSSGSNFLAITLCELRPPYLCVGVWLPPG
jgi:hypothetical protein